MTTFEEERNRIRERVWSLLELKPGDHVLDVGVGHIAYSRNKLIELGTRFTSIDLDWSILRKHKTAKANSVQCNAAQLPFRDQVFELVLANFTFHEINPALHRTVISEFCRVSKRIMIVEPDIGEDPLCRRFQELWTVSMHSIQKFEDYKTLDGWTDRIKSGGVRITTTRKLQSSVRLCGQEAMDYMETVVDNLREEGVPDQYIQEMRDLAQDVAKKGMIFSDVNVIIGHTGR
jgi:ubiquinone/menaquinone biosynthesis C-methylase UbiE